MRIHLLALPVLLATCAGLARGQAGGLNGDFCVAANGSDAWSGTLSAPNGARTDGPFATLSRAQKAVRERVAAGLRAGVKVLVRGGTYYLPRGLSFGPGDGGTQKHAITYAAYPGEHPSLVGGMRVTKWTGLRLPGVSFPDTPEGRRLEGILSSVREAPFPRGHEPNQLFENGRRLTLARAPDTGYFRVEGVVKGRPKSAFVYRQRDIDPSGFDWSVGGKGWHWRDGRVFMWPTHDWFSTDKAIAGIDLKTRIISLGDKGGYAIRRGNRYFVKNVLALLDRPGECQVSKAKRTLYCWPRKMPIAEQTLVAATADNLIRIQGTPDKPVRNLHFRGLDLGIARADLVRAINAVDCSLRFCTIENAGQCGVYVGGHSQRVTLYGNLIRFHGHHGVSLAGTAYGKPYANHHHVVENNHIHHCGRLLGHGYGIRVWQSGHNRIVHNHIHHMPRYGTTIKGLRYQALRKQVKGVTWANRHDFLHSRNNLFAYNHIHHTNLDSQDTGAMESWGPGRDNVYDHNLIHDTGNRQFNIQSGMYLDDATDYFAVTNNVIYGVVGTGGDQPIYAKGIGNRIVNNVLIVGPTNTSAIRSLYMAQERCDRHVYTHNIIVFEAKRGAVYDFNNWSDDRVARSDSNVFWKPGGKLTIKGSPASGSFDKWRAILGKKFDRHSIVADPRFVDAARRDYRLRADSPALKLGIKSIDARRIGLKPDFPERLGRE